MKRRIRLPKGLLPKPSKIVKRGIYECLTAATGGKVKHRDYGKRIKKGRY